MTRDIILSEGFKIDSLRIPSFALRQNEVVSLIWPLDKGHPSETLVVDVLTGQQKHPRVHILDPVVRANRPYFYRTLFGSIELVKILDRCIPRKFKAKYYKSFHWHYAMKYQGRFSSINELSHKIPLFKKDRSHSNSKTLKIYEV